MPCHHSNGRYSETQKSAKCPVGPKARSSDSLLSWKQTPAARKAHCSENTHLHWRTNLNPNNFFTTWATFLVLLMMGSDDDDDGVRWWWWLGQMTGSQTWGHVRIQSLRIQPLNYLGTSHTHTGLVLYWKDWPLLLLSCRLPLCHAASIAISLSKVLRTHC